MDTQALSTAGQAAALFDFPGPVTAMEPYGEGHINDTYRLGVRAGEGETRRFILQRLNTQVFKDPKGLMDNVTAVTRYLEKAMGGEGAPHGGQAEILRVIPTKAGENHLTLPNGEVWRAYNFIEGGVSFQTADDPRLIAASAHAFGRFARLLDGFPAESLHETIPKFHDTRSRLADFEKALAADCHGRAAACRPEIEFVQAHAQDCAMLMNLLEAGELPARVTHNDTKLNNVLINPETMHGVCVIDLDTVMPGLIHNDFGDAIRTCASTAAEDEQDLNKVRFDFEKYRLYAESYLAEVGGILRPKEREMLPWGARLMTLECGMRFLTDHLQGDVYFKIHRPGHNLDRARTQFRLVTGMVDAWAELCRL
ncbi:aminoglycoside phosphotransferase family protein [Ruminococcaceae bacterium OttesenSCG-928-D13]|nr:aminoglycoside phosphotransferase family protein [Ruminococcaceae bacterium OttesenSCG-928-D13]